MLTQTLFVMLSKAKHLFFNAILRAFTFVQDDKFAKKQVAGQLLYYCLFFCQLQPMPLLCLCISSINARAVSIFFTFSTVIMQRPSPSRTLQLNWLVGI